MGVARTPALSDVHPAVARGGGVLRADDHQGRRDDGADEVRPGRGAGHPIEERKITATMLVPSMIYALMDHPDSHTRDLSSLETVYYGASAMNPVRLAEAIRAIRADLSRSTTDSPRRRW